MAMPAWSDFANYWEFETVWISRIRLTGWTPSLACAGGLESGKPQRFLRKAISGDLMQTQILRMHCAGRGGQLCENRSIAPTGATSWRADWNFNSRVTFGCRPG